MTSLGDCKMSKREVEMLLQEADSGQDGLVDLEGTDNLQHALTCPPYHRLCFLSPCRQLRLSRLSSCLWSLPHFICVYASSHFLCFQLYYD